MAEKTPNQQLAEKLLYKPAYVTDKDADVKQKAHDFAEGYKKFLDNGKTEREVAAESEQMLKDAGYVEFDPKKTYNPGDKVYFVQFKKAVVAATIGTRSFEDGFRLVIAHTDSPRLDLRPTPLYESDHLSYFKTHYYGGVRKYQWGTMPLSIHGVFTRDDGSTVTVRVGEDENDPVFCITDLLPHLGAEQNARTLKDGIKAEELNILIGSDAVEDEDVKEAVKLNTMILLNEKYGITEKEFMRAEIEITPAYKSRDVGFDRSMVGSYGHDDRVDAYPALVAEIETKNPAYTTVCVLTDKEEIGSDGVTGMQSMYAFHFMQELCRAAGQDDIAIEYQRDGKKHSTSVALKEDERLGVYASTQVVHLDPITSARLSFSYVVQTAEGVMRLLQPQHTMEVLDQSTSIVGISVMSSQAAAAGPATFLTFAALISFSLGFMNLLPIPPLDGGKLVIEIIQKIAGRELPLKVQTIVSYVGIALFVLLFIYMLRSDILRFIL